MATEIDNIRARLLQISEQLLTLPVTGSVSDQGRSVSYDRAGLLAEQKQLREQLVLLSGPFVQASRHKA